MIKDWELTPEGSVALAPVVAWDSAIGGMYGLLRLQFVRGEEQLIQGQFETVQVAMTSKQARQLADDLLQIADRLDGTEWGAPQ